MAGARDVIQEQRRIRREQKRRNAEAIAEAQRRLTQLEEEANALRPSVRRERAARESGVHHVKQADPPDNKAMKAGENKGETVLQFDTQTARSLAERFLAEKGDESDDAKAFVEMLTELAPSGTNGFTEDDVEDVILAITDDLSGIEFASNQAASLAADAGLPRSAFATREPSGGTGFTVADVRAIVDEAQNRPQDDEDDEGEQAGGG